MSIFLRVFLDTGVWLLLLSHHWQFIVHHFLNYLVRFLNSLHLQIAFINLIHCYHVWILCEWIYKVKVRAMERKCSILGCRFGVVCDHQNEFQQNGTWGHCPKKKCLLLFLWWAVIVQIQLAWWPMCLTSFVQSESLIHIF